MSDTKTVNSVWLEAQHIGAFEIPDGKVDVADPSSDRGDYPALGVRPGIYYCKAYTEKRNESSPVWACMIVRADDFGKGRCGVREIAKESNWEKVTSVKVYTGLAGFFTKKPDFTSAEWERFCEDIGYEKKTFIHPFAPKALADGFFTCSGNGDGEYPVYAIKKQGKIVALEIRFYKGEANSDQEKI